MRNIVLMIALCVSAQARAYDLSVPPESIANETSEEIVECAAFYSIGAQCSENTHPGSGELGRKSAARAIKGYYIVGKAAGLSDDALMSRSRLTIKALRDWMSDSCVNISILLERYGDRCKPLIEHPETRYNELLAGKPAWSPIP